MKYKLAAIDLDGTLLSKDKTIPKENKDAVLNARERGLEIIIASGRAYAGVKDYNFELGLDTYSIVNVGGSIMDAGGNEIFHDRIEMETTQSILDYAKSRNSHVQLYLGDGNYHYAEYSDAIRYYLEFTGYAGIEDPRMSNPIDSSLQPTKILVIDDSDMISIIREELEAIHPKLTYGRSAPRYLDITSPTANKGAALRYLSELMGFAPEEVVAIGDSEIDISMFKYAGLSAAVADSSDAVKTAANYICKDPNLGVAEVLNKL